ncbi:MAG: NADH-quinone oxidoreductase subunit H [Archangium gephyra]|uniref:NADH-quinone oxidoreductase subunit H n=1 Tax=Archangium gephyra TaxID=48 RepID=A0A2W5TED7_9BACT|nr:MAG: NADH-quinone oxidoreductase subunit H [Archangium gephyra]
MARIGQILLAIGTIVGSLFGIMAAAYAVGGLVEDLGRKHLGIPGLSHITNILVLMLVVVMVIATLLTLAERKWSAYMQDRVGPNRARLSIIPGLKNRALGGIPHIITDVLKLLTKEAFRPTKANSFLFNIAPMLAFAPVFALFAVVPAGPTLNVGGNDVMMVAINPDFGLLFLLAIASLAVYGTSLAGWASNNKFALLGGVRASSQMISYEVALGLSLVGMMIAFGTVRLAGAGGMAESQAAYLWKGYLGSFDIGLPSWGIFLQPLGFVLFFAAAFAETKRAPFDSPEGESEIVGYFLEYSGMQFGLFMISEFVEIVVLSGVLTAIFFGGWSLPVGNEWVQNLELMKNYPILQGAFFGTVFWIKVIFLIYLQLVIRWTMPRFRYDQVQKLGWQILLPMGLINLFVSGALILLDPSLRYLALFGFVVLGIFAFLTVTPPKQLRDERAAADAHGGHGHGHDDHGHGHDDHGHDAHANSH